MGAACTLNARRCDRTRCRYTGPYYFAMIVPVMALGARLVTAGTFGWVWLGLIIPGSSGLISWATERAWGKFSYRTLQLDRFWTTYLAIAELNTSERERIVYSIHCGAAQRRNNRPIACSLQPMSESWPAAEHAVYRCSLTVADAQIGRVATQGRSSSSPGSALSRMSRSCRRGRRFRFGGLFADKPTKAVGPDQSLLRS